MTYTLEQKRDALSRGELWWRFPHGAASSEREWGLVSEDLIAPIPDDILSISRAEFFVGQTAPRLLSELERELLGALESMVGMHEEGASLHGLVGPTIDSARALIAKAKGEQ